MPIYPSPAAGLPPPAGPPPGVLPAPHLLPLSHWFFPDQNTQSTQPRRRPTQLQPPLVQMPPPSRSNGAASSRLLSASGQATPPSPPTASARRRIGSHGASPPRLELSSRRRPPRLAPEATRGIPVRLLCLLDGLEHVNDEGDVRTWTGVEDLRVLADIGDASIHGSATPPFAARRRSLPRPCTCPGAMAASHPSSTSSSAGTGDGGPRASTSSTCYRPTLRQAAAAKRPPNPGSEHVGGE